MHEGLPFITMELLAGETLADRLSRGTPSRAEALAVADGLAAALDAAHREGVLHRDFKSGNVMLVERGGAIRPIVTDFGLALEVGAATGTAGTPGYMAPEQACGEVTARSDVYAFGVVL